MIIVVTGSRKGIGRKIAEYYLGKGNIVIGCSRSTSDLQHNNYLHFELDISIEDNILQMLTAIRQKYSYIDVLINNVGAAMMNHLLLTPIESAKRIMDINFFGTMIMCREFTKLLRKSQNPRIINLTSLARPLNLEGEAIYASSKAAIETFTKVIAKELSMYNITVNAIGPNPIETDLIKNVPKEKIMKIIERQAIKRFGTIEDIVNIIDFFIDSKSNFITGQIIYLGGLS